MARPTQFDEPVACRVVIRLTKRQRRALVDAARDNHTSIAGAIREAINDYVADYSDDPPVFCMPKLRT